MTLSQDVVLDAAAAVASSGLDALSVRAVAGALDVTPMALYRHVGDAATLEAATVERLLASLPVIGPDGDLSAWAHDARRVLATTPGLARHVLLRWTGIPRCLVVVDRLVASLSASVDDAVAAANVVFTYVLVRAQAEEELRRAGIERDLAVLRSMRAEVPLLWANRRRYQRARLDEHFAYGLDAILRGIDAHP